MIGAANTIGRIGRMTPPRHGRQFQEEIEDVEPDDYVPFEVGPSVWKLMFALSEITGMHYLAEAPLGRRPLRS